MNRVKSLDGLRALSIIMVLVGHSLETMPPALGDNRILHFLANSSLGVRIFFVISGYLITKLLIIEREKNGYIDLRNFYIRRTFRIFPVFYLYILTVLLIKLFFFSNIFSDYAHLGFASVYLWNYQHLFHTLPDPNGYWFFGHFWSLSMEEQFYLFWPLLFIRIPNRDTLTKVVVAIIVAMPFIRLATYFVMPGSRGQMSMMLQTGGDCILTGCLGALLEKNVAFKAKYKSYIQNKWVILAAVIFLFVIDKSLSLRFKGSYDMLVGKSLSNVCIMIFIFWAIYVPSPVSKVFNYKRVVYIGVLSYSFYIWQQLFLTPLMDTWANKFPQNLLVVFVIGNISYYCIEKPILGLKNRFQRKARPVIATPAGPAPSPEPVKTTDEVLAG